MNLDVLIINGQLLCFECFNTSKFVPSGQNVSIPSIYILLKSPNIMEFFS